MLVSQAVSENIVPGIAKTIEQYIIVNMHNDVVSSPEVKRQLNFKIKRGKFFATENVSLTEGEDDMFGNRTKTQTDKDQDKRDDEEQRKRDAWEADEQRKKEIHQTKLDKEKREKEKYNRQKQKEDDEAVEKAKEKAKEQELAKAKRAKADVKVGDNKAMSIEPSYMTVEVTDRNGNTRKQFLGIKVVPFRVKSDEKLSRLIMHDTQMKTMQAGMVALGRKVTKYVYRIFDVWTRKARVLGGLTPSGDPRRDIIFDRTGLKGGGFVVLSKTEDIDDVFLSNINKINRLFKLGWGNIIIADDINRQAFFCMKQFRGVCNAISYKIMYQNFGMAKVYDDLEDAKRQNSSLFRIRKQFNKVVSEWITEYRYLKYISEDNHDE
jgi:hypothetical protein